MKDDVFLLNFYSLGIGFSINCFTFSLPNSGNLQSLLIPKDNLINELTPEKISPFLKNNLNLSQENLVKTVIDSYIKQLTVSL